MVVTVVRSSLLLVVLVLVAGPGSAEETNTTEAAPQPTWVCEDVSVKSNLTMRQVLGEWFLLELDDGTVNRPEDVCLTLSLTDLRDDDGHNRSAVHLAVFRDRSDGSRDLRMNYSAYFPKDRPGELVAGDLNAVWRVHSLSADGRVLVMGLCNIHRELYWMTLGVSEDSLPADIPQRSSFSVRRDANVCRLSAESNTK